MEDIERQHYLQKLQASNRELQNFVYAVSHDLSAPLHHIMFFAKDLKERLHDRLDDEEREDFERIIGSSKRLQNLVYELLQYSRIESRGISFNLSDCTEVLKDALDNLETTIKESEATVDYTPLPVLTIDRVQVTQVFQNLIDNAVKFRSSAPPYVTVQACEEEDFWKISIKDNGIGIEPKFHSEIFTIFRRLHTDAEYPGTGMGLALCKRIINRHGGEIWVESVKNKGSEFCFTLPKKQVNEYNLKNYKGLNGVCVL